MDVPLGAVLAAGVEPDGVALEGGALGWAAGVGGLVGCRGMERKSGLSQCLRSFHSPKGQGLMLTTGAVFVSVSSALNITHGPILAESLQQDWETETVATPTLQMTRLDQRAK